MAEIQDSVGMQDSAVLIPPGMLFHLANHSKSDSILSIVFYLAGEVILAQSIPYCRDLQ